MELDTPKNPTLLMRTSEFDAAFRRGESAVVALVIERIMQIDGVTKVLEKWRGSEVMPTIAEVVRELQAIREFQGLSESTQLRRARTIRAWCIWIIQHTD
jgi:site-specific recombinase XerC